MDGRKNNGRHKNSSAGRTLGLRTGTEATIARKLTAEGMQRQKQYYQDWDDHYRALMRWNWGR